MKHFNFNDLYFKQSAFFLTQLNQEPVSTAHVDPFLWFVFS